MNEKILRDIAFLKLDNTGFLGIIGVNSKFKANN
jgi:hypothetical protein